MKKFFKKGGWLGFTLVELLIVMAIIVALAMALIIAINPVNLIDRAQDSKRRTDMDRIKIALEEYFNDKDCYPNTVPFGQMWMVDDTPLLQVPQDPKYPEQTYIYISGLGCSKWYAMFYRLMAKNNGMQVQGAGETASSNCGLPIGCLPMNYQSSWGCLISGNVDCGVISAAVLPTNQNYIATNQVTSYPTTAPETILPTSTSFLPTSVPNSSPSFVYYGPDRYTGGTDGTWCIQRSRVYQTPFDSILSPYYYGQSSTTECHDSLGTVTSYPSTCLNAVTTSSFYCTYTIRNATEHYNNHCVQAVGHCLPGDSCLPSAGVCIQTPAGSNTSSPVNTVYGTNSTFCQDSDAGSTIQPNATCTDNQGTHTDYCTSDGLVYNDHCSWHSNGQVNCEGFVSRCLDNCNHAKCGQYYITVPTPTFPSNIGSTGL